MCCGDVACANDSTKSRIRRPFKIISRCVNCGNEDSVGIYTAEDVSWWALHRGHNTNFCCYQGPDKCTYNNTYRSKHMVLDGSVCAQHSACKLTTGSNISSFRLAGRKQAQLGVCEGFTVWQARETNGVFFSFFIFLYYKFSSLQTRLHSCWRLWARFTE